MKLAIVFAAVVAVSSAQFNQYGQQPRLPLPPTPRPPLPSPVPRPFVAPQVNRVATADQAANIIRYDNDIGPEGSFQYAFETDNGIAAQAQGVPRNFGGNPPVAPVVSTGSFSWYSPEGIPIGISYTADENGYQPSGDAIPTPPPIPELILKALDFIARNPPAPQKK